MLSRLPRRHSVEENGMQKSFTLLPPNHSVRETHDTFTVAFVETEERSGERRMLVQLRDNGRFGLPGGRVEARRQETPQEAVAREIQEEHGIRAPAAQWEHVVLRVVQERVGKFRKVTELHVFFIPCPGLSYSQALELSAGARDLGREVMGTFALPCAPGYYADLDRKWQFQSGARIMAGQWEYPHRELLMGVVYDAKHQARCNGFLRAVRGGGSQAPRPTRNYGAARDYGPRAPSSKRTRPSWEKSGKYQKEYGGSNRKPHPTPSQGPSTEVLPEKEPEERKAPTTDAHSYTVDDPVPVTSPATPPSPKRRRASSSPVHHRYSTRSRQAAADEQNALASPPDYGSGVAWEDV